jgi:tRNA-binding EMAP/Myf-like protein
VAEILPKEPEDFQISSGIKSAAFFKKGIKSMYVTVFNIKKGNI